ncbi:histidinol-phosphate transaminase [Thermotoga sp. KOL6]|uniref:histidinol-phosphate transaminase n=1 Tax=Thermotoga sp. KOL6 TaxID=126741 RepID=UPI000C758768|nr:histidinol-phosphate transaminase [Thermotoga sp. KOL6]PLV59792.1 histidinol-phosphate aminotransferase [Thermotoga sp. KOL6]
MNPLDVISKSAYPYTTEERTGIYLALNENPFSFPKELTKEVFRKLDSDKMRIYYDSPDEELIEKLLSYVEKDFLTKKNVSIGNGADEIIYVMMLMFNRVVFFPPTYSCYKIFAKAVGMKYLEVPLKEGFHLPEVEVGEGDVVFIPNPNNPTGHIFEKDEIERILQTGAFVALDEAYYEFHGRSYIDLLKEYDNIAILRTFSKAFSLAAQRIGYVLSSEKFIDAYNRVRLPFNVSYVSQTFAKVALDHVNIFKDRVQFIVEERERMKKVLKEMGYSITDSRGNFVFIFLEGEKRNRLVDLFRCKGIAVRVFKEGVRITVGTREENDAILRELEGFK